MKRIACLTLALFNLVGVSALITLAGVSPANSQTVSVVMSGLDNPRGLAFGPEGALYVVEAGRGGNGPSVFLRGALRS